MPTNQSHAESCFNERLVLGRSHCPSYHATREEIKHNGKIEPSDVTSIWQEYRQPTSHWDEWQWREKGLRPL